MARGIGNRNEHQHNQDLNYTYYTYYTQSRMKAGG